MENTKTERAPSLTLLLAQNEFVLTEFRQLVFEQYKMRDWLNPEDYPDGQVGDMFDASSDILVVRSDEEVIAGMRIVKDTGLGFPHENLLSLNQFTPHGYYEKEILRKLSKTERGALAEITRLAGKKRQRFLTFDLAKCIYWYAKYKEIELYLMVVDMDFFQLCFKLGIPIDPIGVPVLCEGSWTIPAVIDPMRFEKEISQKNQSAWNYIATPNNLEGNWSTVQTSMLL